MSAAEFIAPVFTGPPPVITEPPSDPINIDPNVEYIYVIPVSGETSLHFDPTEDFELELAGHALTVKYVGAAIAGTFSVRIVASNAHGSVEQILNFRVREGSTVVLPSLNTSGIIDYSGNTLGGFVDSGVTTDFTLFSGILPSDVLAVGDRVRFRYIGSFSSQMLEVLYWVTAVTSTYFRVATTSGGTSMNGALSESFYLSVAVAVAGSDTYWLGDTSGLVVDQAIQLFSGPAAAPVSFTDKVYVKTIIDDAHIKIAATVGGTAIVAPATIVPDKGTSSDDITVYGYYAGASGRLYPAIDSDAEVSANYGDDVSYQITADTATDYLFVEGLPAGLSIDSDGLISGAAIESGRFTAILLAVKGTRFSARYLIIVIGERAGDITAGARKLGALTLRFACNQQSRDAMTAIGTGKSAIIWLGNPTRILAAIFDGNPSNEDSFISDLSNISGAELVIRKDNAEGDIIVSKALTVDAINGQLTLAQWEGALSQHLEFDLTEAETNPEMPANGVQAIYGAISVTIPAGDITIGVFQGQIKDDGIGDADEPDQVNAFEAYAPSAAGTDTIAAGAGSLSIIAAIGAGAYTRKFVLETTNVALGALKDIYIDLPASGNPTIEIRNATAGGTTVHSVTGVSSGARYQNVRIRFNGTAWVKFFSGFIS